MTDQETVMRSYLHFQPPFLSHGRALIAHSMAHIDIMLVGPWQGLYHD
jgi:hypothetical protein